MQQRNVEVALGQNYPIVSNIEKKQVYRLA
jgi:hypothetical protein